MGDWKAIHLNVARKKGAQRKVELYDLSQDPSEKKNVANKHPEIVDKAKRLFVESHRPSKFWSFEFKSDLQPAGTK